MPGGGMVIFRSLDDPDNARGHSTDGAIIDEAGFVKAKAWYGIIQPMLADTHGWALLTGTPNGRNWFWREHVAALEREDSVAWQVPTLGVRIVDGRLERWPEPLENADFRFSEAEAMFQRMPQRTFEQEFLAEFIEDAGGVFRNVRQMSTVHTAEPEEEHRYVFGVDWAKSYDWTVISIVDSINKRQVAIDRFNQIDYRFQVARLKVLAEKWNPDLIVAESNSMGEPLIEELEYSGLPVEAFRTTPTSKKEAIEALALAIERGELSLLADEVQIAELQAYETVRLPSGTFRYTAPEGIHDDTVMALALAWHGAKDAGPAVIELW